MAKPVPSETIALRSLAGVVKRLDPQRFEVTLVCHPQSAKMLSEPDSSRKIHLTEKETAILKYLYRMGDRPVTRAELELGRAALTRAVMMASARMRF